MTSDETTVRRILEAAYELFAEKGYRGSSMREIAERSGIKAGSIYNHFKNKEEIFEAVFIEKHPLFRLLSLLDEVEGESAEELLSNAIDQLNNEIGSDPRLLNLFFVELVEMGGKHITEAMETNFPPDSKFMKQIFIMKDEFREIREPLIIRTLIGSVFANIIFNWFIGGTNPRRWGTQSEMTDVLLRGILKD
ncbi:MAG: TetR/AcrR family transcriptional regulator [Candidatus Thorarchaeota archaeon]